jgi:vitamin B12 transporter
MRSLFSGTLAAALVALAGGPAVAETATATVAAPIEVEAGEAPLPATPDPTATVHAVPPERLARAQARGEGLGRLVDQVAGARVLDLGGPGGQQQVTLRGGAGAQALVVVDGVPLRLPFARGFDLGLLPAELLETVEVARGGQGAAWGDGALTGALVLRSRDGGRPHQSVTLTLGSFGTAQAAAVVAGEGLSATASYQRTDGDFGYTSSLVGLPDVARVRENNDSQRAAVSLGARGGALGGVLEVRGAGAFRAAGVPGLADTPGESRVARERAWHGRVQANLRRPLDLGDGGELVVALHGAVLDLAYRDPAQGVVSDVGMVVAGADAGATLGVFEAHLVQVQLQGAGEGVYGADYPARWRLGAAVTDEWALGNLTVFGALRGQGVGGQAFALLPRLGLRYQVTDALHLRAGAGRSLRTPTLDELYHPVEVAFSGNPELRAERAWEAEVGAGLAAGGLSAQLTGYLRRIEDAVLYLNRDAFLVRPENVGAARAAGGELELGARGRLGPVRLQGEAQGSLLASVLDATGARLPTQPVWSFALDGLAALGPVAVDTTLRGFGPTYVNLRPSEENRVQAYLRWDAGVRVSVGRYVTVGAEVLNLLDVRTLASVNRFPLPGRTFFATLRISSGE